MVLCNKKRIENKNMKNIEKEELHQIFSKLKVNKQEELFNQLYNKYQKLVYAIAFSILKNKHDSEEIMQQVFLKIWQMEKEKLPVANEASWLYSVTKNEAINFIKNKKEELNIENVYYISSENKELDEVIEQQTYNKIISKLTTKEQEIVSLKILSNLSFKQISQILNMPIGTVQWKYYKSIHTLKILLGNLSMFIITISLFFAGETKNRKKEANMLEEEQKEESAKKEQAIQKVETDNIENDRVELSNENNELTENTIIQDTSQSSINKVNIGILSISSIFLIITIIFTIIFIKHQQKAKKKMSK